VDGPWYPREGRHFRKAQLIQRLAEVHLRRRGNSIRSLAEEDLVHIQRKDLLLGEFGLHQQRNIDLAHLALHVPVRGQEHVAGHLHGDGTRPLADPPGSGIGERRPQNPLPINTMVAEKAIVLGSEEGLNELRGNCRSAPGCDVARRSRRSTAHRGCKPAAAPAADLPETVDIGQGGLQIDISADIREGDQRDRRREDTQMRDMRTR